jgi:hypothetical protein
MYIQDIKFFIYVLNNILINMLSNGFYFLKKALKNILY